MFVTYVARHLSKRNATLSYHGQTNPTNCRASDVLSKDSFLDISIYEHIKLKDLVFKYVITKSIMFQKLVGPVLKLLAVPENRKLADVVYCLMRPTYFKHFCAGENLADARETLRVLKESGVQGILDYAVESSGDSSSETVSVFKDALKTSQNSSVMFTCIKLTSLASPELLTEFSKKISNMKQEDYPSWAKLLIWSPPGGFAEAVRALPSAEKTEISESLMSELISVVSYLEDICECARDVPSDLLIDAEYSYFQPAIDAFALGMMMRYNRDHPLIYNTYQMYLKECPKKLESHFELADRNGFQLAAKVVRGAYMVSEGELAHEKSVPSPIWDTIDQTHQAYNEAVAKFIHRAVKNVGAVLVATHNPDSVIEATKVMHAVGIKPENKRVSFAQLYGMCDNVSIALAKAGYNCCKYLPFGPVKSVLPYLTRRLQENSSILDRLQDNSNMVRQSIVKKLRI